ncbi:hypothetical protein Mp_4g01120 [Marchantia polymorpha subsp. ruderalis]|uniref:Uncharacterized protein n=2 Tax=Marchantia polymorpha TaxID=3197 RepID=A0AAF6B528_MARPO|nr:hypothetical protein MARPO_0066s0030 [Marchantia polymorpha]BBN07112.1 hypothetical protein Mp_4g01120 [Marchantia polymorpha subsp. ruderalis]|eukprot:PTQ36071.1 hypothetical protein MARPO_0066s0030 [Marchantia polymorpha]
MKETGYARTEGQGDRLKIKIDRSWRKKRFHEESGFGGKERRGRRRRERYDVRGREGGREGGADRAGFKDSRITGLRAQEGARTRTRRSVGPLAQSRSKKEERRRRRRIDWRTPETSGDGAFFLEHERDAREMKTFFEFGTAIEQQQQQRQCQRQRQRSSSSVSEDEAVAGSSSSSSRGQGAGAARNEGGSSG